MADPRQPAADVAIAQAVLSAILRGLLPVKYIDWRAMRYGLAAAVLLNVLWELVPDDIVNVRFTVQIQRFREGDDKRGHLFWTTQTELLKLDGKSWNKTKEFGP